MADRRGDARWSRKGYAWAGLGLVLGAGAGLVLGLLVTSDALGLFIVAGAAIGLILGAIVEAFRGPTERT